jgi:SsrA-binding protein
VIQSVHMKKILNKKARFDFQILETLEAGIQLTGSEVKSIKNGRLKLDAAFIKIIGGEAYLVHANIPLYENARIDNYDPNRTRKLLLRRKQLVSLTTTLKQNKLTLVPVSCYNTRNLIKIEVGLAKRKKGTDKRKTIQERDLKRETERALRNKR